MRERIMDGFDDSIVVRFAGLTDRRNLAHSCRLQIWVPTEKIRPGHRVDLSDLMSAGCLQPGATLTPRQQKHKDKAAILLPDGRIDLAETIYATASEAARAITGGRDERLVVLPG
jgi:hypothetical protein